MENKYTKIMPSKVLIDNGDTFALGNSTLEYMQAQTNKILLLHYDLRKGNPPISGIFMVLYWHDNAKWNDDTPVTEEEKKQITAHL